MMARVLIACVAAAPFAMAMAASVPTPSRPHIVMALTDDLGWNYPGYHNPEVITPTLDKLAAEGVRLESHYTYKYCAPTRGSFLTGRLPFHLAATRCNLIPSSIPEGTALAYTMLPKVLARSGYQSYHVGKWHQGFQTAAYTPVGRGFNGSYGFLQGGQDHWTHWCGASKANCNIAGPDANKAGAWDLWEQSTAKFPGAPVLGINGTLNDTATYSGYIFTNRVVEIVQQHDAKTPLFVYWAIHNTHAPIEAPERFVSPYNSFGDRRKEVFSAMVSAVDEAVLNVTSALKSKDMWANTIFVWTTDNGSPVQVGGSNHPLKGGKGKNWEGGIRTPAFVCGGFLGPKNRGKLLYGLVAVADWYATFAVAASGTQAYKTDSSAAAAGLPPPDGLDLWPYISGAVVASPRTEIVLDHHMFTNASATNGTCGGQVPFAVPGVAALGALRQGDWKLIVGPEAQAFWYGNFTPNVSVPFSKRNATPTERCLPGCLYNIAKDMGEHFNVAGVAANKPILSKMLARFKELESEYHPRVLAPPALKDAFCDAAIAHSGFTAPYCGVAPEGAYCD